MVQSNSIGESFNTALNIPTWVIGAIVALLAAFIFLGGISRIASVTEKLVPIMAALYLLGGLVIIVARIQYIPETFGMIFKYAFMPQAIIGGGIGYALKQAISQGAKRGLFSNEAGMGSTPHAHALANVKTPHEQGITAMIGVFIDTFVVLTMTALIAISTLYAGNGPLSAAGIGAEAAGLAKTNMIQVAVGKVCCAFMGAGVGAKVGAIFVAICLAFFAFSTILSWNLFGKVNAVYLFGKKSVPVYSVIALVFVFLGTLMSNDLVWELTDMFNNLMVIPNAIALFALGSMVAKSAKEADDMKKLKK
jgi:AGCS family alanine or glycine:cation symporter